VAISALRAITTTRPEGAGDAGAPTDEQLLRRCRAGSEEAFATIVARYEAMLRGHCARIVGRGAAEDAVQETFVAAWVALQAGVEVRGLKPWLFTIAGRKALKARARSHYTSELSDTLSGPRSCPEEAAESARAREALAALAALPATQRDALVGSALHGRSGIQLARQLGVTEATVRQLVFRARERMRLAAAACIAPPLALLRLIRRSATAATSGQGPLAAATSLKAGAVLAAAAATVVAGTTLHFSPHTVLAPVAHPPATSIRVGTSRATRESQERRLSLAPATLSRSSEGPRHTPRGALDLTHFQTPIPAGAATLATSPVPTPGTFIASAIPAAVTAADPIRTLEPTVARAAGKIQATAPLAGPTVKPLVSALAPASQEVGNNVKLAETAAEQDVNSAAQTVAGDVGAVVQRAPHATKAAATARPHTGATTQGVPSVVTGVGAPVVGAVGTVIPSVGTTAATGPLSVPGLR
jgi:RNA polymerase sigma factor (sigma-70 family)